MAKLPPVKTTGAFLVVDYGDSFKTREFATPHIGAFDKSPGCLGFIGDYTTQLYGDCNKP